MRLALAITLVIATAGIARANDLAFARRFIAAQIKAIDAGDLHTLRTTVEHWDRLTAAMVANARGKLAPIDELVGSATRDKLGNIVITRKNGKRLTVLVEADGTWRTLTLWFTE